MTEPTPSQAAERVERYLVSRGRMRGIEQEEIASAHSGDDDSPQRLLASDLRVLITAARAYDDNEPMWVSE